MDYCKKVVGGTVQGLQKMTTKEGRKEWKKAPGRIARNEDGCANGLKALKHLHGM